MLGARGDGKEGCARYPDMGVVILTGSRRAGVYITATRLLIWDQRTPVGNWVPGGVLHEHQEPRIEFSEEVAGSRGQSLFYLQRTWVEHNGIKSRWGWKLV